MKTKKFCQTIIILATIIAATIIVTEVRAKTNESTTELSVDRLILELDMNELPEFVGRTFDVNFTAVTKAETVTVTMYFDDLINQPVWQRTADFFVNKRAIIDVVAAELIPGIAHDFTILAEDSDNQSTSIEQSITVDTIMPSFVQLSLEHIDEDGQVSLVTTNYVDLTDREYLRLNYTVYDINFDYVAIFIDEKTDMLEYPSSMSINLGSGYFVIELYGVIEQTFDLRVIAYDEALNEAEFLWAVKYYRSDEESIPKDEADRLIEEEKEKQKQAAWRAGIAAIISAITGACVGILGTVVFIKRSGIQSILDNDQTTGFDDDHFLRKEEEKKESKAVEAAKKYQKQQEEKALAAEKERKAKTIDKELKKRMILRRFFRWFKRKWKGE